MDDIIISFCLPVYNQRDLVERCIKSIIGYKKNNIEIVVNDDNSTEDIQGLVAEIDDDRIHYYKNENNLGHDRNIINSFKHARGKYVYLLRSRDYMIKEAIDHLVEKVSLSNCVYITATAINEMGQDRYVYEDTIIHQGKDTLEAHFRLFVHPSGSAYIRDQEIIANIERFIISNVDNKFGFLVHSLLRIQLSQIGDFQLISKPTWVYVDTSKQQDIAFNKTSNNKSVYDPEYTIKRFECEAKWAYEVFSKNKYSIAFEKLYCMYLEAITWGFKYKNSDKRLQKHYQYKKRKFSVLKEQDRFYKTAIEIYCKTTNVKMVPDSLKKRIKSINKRNMARGWFKYFVMYILKDSILYNKVALLYKKIKYSKNGKR